MHSILLLICGRSENTYQLPTSIRFLPPFLCWFCITQGGKVFAFWFIFTDSEMSMMINCTALRFCCGAYLCGPNSETNKCVMPCRRQIAKLSYNQVIHSLCWTEYFRNLFVIQIFYHWEGGWFLILKWAYITLF
jgi:hypothetical protein